MYSLPVSAQRLFDDSQTDAALRLHRSESLGLGLRIQEGRELSMDLSA